MAKVDENGNVEYRITLPAIVNSRLSKLANLENRSVPLMVRQLMYEGLAYRQFEKNKASIIESILKNGDPH